MHARKKHAGKKRTTSIPWIAVLLGSFMPDVPLGILSLAATFYFRQVLGDQSPDLMENVLHPLYFNNPFWLAATSILHSPLALSVYLILLWRWRSQTGKVQHWLFWFFASSGLHAIIDILTHFDDGPLLFWPLNWNIRFHSPISYWDPAHFGREFLIFEVLLDVALLSYLFIPKIVTYFRHRKETGG